MQEVLHLLANKNSVDQSLYAATMPSTKFRYGRLDFDHEAGWMSFVFKAFSRS